MSANLVRKLSNKKAPVWVLKMMGRLWGPYLGAGINVDFVQPDFRLLKVSLRKRWYSTNYVGTQFGGSIYAMTDPFYMLMLMSILGPDFVVWDKSAFIRFKRPGKTHLYASFELSDEDIEYIKQQVSENKKLDFEKKVLVTDTSGETVAEVDKVIYVADKQFHKSRSV